MQSTSPELTCRELVELVTDYFEGALSPEAQARFDQHMAKCDWCKLYLDQMRATVLAMGKLTEDSITPQAQAELLNAFRGWKRP